MKEEDKERIEKAAKIHASTPPMYFGSEHVHELISRLEVVAYKTGANTEHPIAFNQGKIEGFNEGIEAAIKVITELNYPHGELSESLILPEIEKLKKNSIKSLKNSLNLVSHGTCRRKANRLQ